MPIINGFLNVFLLMDKNQRYSINNAIFAALKAPSLIIKGMEYG